MDNRRKLILAFLVVHLTAIVYQALPAGRLYPPGPPLASGFTWLQRFEAASIQFKASTQPVTAPLRFYARWAGVQQGWNTFAPVPPIVTHKVSVVAVTESGREVELWDDGVDLGGSVGLVYDPQVKLVDVLTPPHEQPLATTFLLYFARRYEQAGLGRPRSLDLREVLIDLPGPGQGRPEAARRVQRLAHQLQAQ